jgi:hypothetical protein
VRLPRYQPPAGSQGLWTAIGWLQSLAVIDEITAITRNMKRRPLLR